MNKLFLGLFAAVSLSHLFACYVDNKRWRNINKPFLMIMLIAFYITSVEAPNMLVVSGLAFGLLGDIILINKKFLKVGAVAFLLGHICYTIAFLSSFSHEAIGTISISLIVIIYFAAIALVVFFIQKGHSIGTLITSSIYLGSLGFMSLTALLQSMSHSSVGATLIFIGSLFFLSSDFLLCTREFRKDIKIPYVNLLVMLTYINAQFLIVLGMIQL